MKRALFITLGVIGVYAMLVVGTFIIGRRLYHPQANMAGATTAQFDSFQKMYNEFCRADEKGDWLTPYRKYMTSDFDASNSIGNGPHWTFGWELTEAKERTTWQQHVSERRYLDSVEIKDGDAIVRYHGHMTCVAGSDGNMCYPYDEVWSAEDTWKQVGGKWMLSASVALTSSATENGEVQPHSSIMPVWVGV